MPDLTVINNPRFTDKWFNDTIQFPRLISEMLQYNDIDWTDMVIKLSDAMDLNEDEVWQLFNRAEAKWEKVKGEL